MRDRPFGITMVAAAFLLMGLTGFAACWNVLPRDANTSPLATIFAFVWGCTFCTASVLTWRRSRLAPPAFLATVGLVAVMLWFLFPGGHDLLRPSTAIAFALAVAGTWAFRRRRIRTA